MYTLPDDFDFQLLSGCYLEMVCFGVGVTRLDFSRPQVAPGIPPYKVSFCIEAGLAYQLNGVPGRREFTDSSTSAPLLDFLLKDVVLVEAVGSATLQISFGSGDGVLVEADPCAEYESYTIYLDSGDVVVV
ncbi:MULTISPECIES: hypothetical protein [Pseudomonas syringae group]|uniref:Uncharacterized protein n=1 Tax=Pseudomonas cichorii TaxID=36746 RepID=A0ABQ1DKD9_PSECI|nr:hypothetical protein [Pseudomonas cichorii]QVE18779.1 hypothetical protein KGD89_08650 [Pseudomonas cichorii]GFM91469.1 hypothetical protein PSCICP_14410 [Pseudomonas cichorii]